MRWLVLDRGGWPAISASFENMVERLCVLKKGILTLADLPERAVKHAGGKSVEGARTVHSLLRGRHQFWQKELEHYENRLIGEALRKANGIYQSSAQLFQKRTERPSWKSSRKGFGSEEPRLLHPELRSPVPHAAPSTSFLTGASRRLLRVSDDLNSGR